MAVDVVVDRADRAARVGERLAGREREDRLEDELATHADREHATPPLDLDAIEQCEVLDAAGELGDLVVLPLDALDREGIDGGMNGRDVREDDDQMSK